MFHFSNIRKDQKLDDDGSIKVEKMIKEYVKVIYIKLYSEKNYFLEVFEVVQICTKVRSMG